MRVQESAANMEITTLWMERESTTYLVVHNIVTKHAECFCRAPVAHSRIAQTPIVPGNKERGRTQNYRCHKKATAYCSSQAVRQVHRRVMGTTDTVPSTSTPSPVVVSKSTPFPPHPISDLRIEPSHRSSEARRGNLLALGDILDLDEQGQVSLLARNGTKEGPESNPLRFGSVRVRSGAYVARHVGRRSTP